MSGRPLLDAPGALGEVGPDETREFRARLAAGDFCLQRCHGCRTEHFPPGPACWRCGQVGLEWLPVEDPSAVVRSAVTIHRSFMAFADQVPYAVVLGELRAHPGVRVIARLAGEAVPIGSGVELVWTGDPSRAGYHWEPRP
ncbi:hypothetical protein GCM10009836_33600 [Pseudonocardia ailaonensis]|uniref:ChsH2 C-terminal OB-fold domain-containing protein n=1 Tax=Pseudonocardia ailaonensis TaxID=367279 RepID=A0ABN2N4Q7_9PSEU